MLCAGIALADRDASAQAGRTEWRTFELITRVEVLQPRGETRIWLPAPLIHATPYHSSIDNSVSAGRFERIGGAAPDSLQVAAAVFAPGVQPVLRMTSRVVTRPHLVDLSSSRAGGAIDRQSIEHFLRPTKLLPTDGIVLETALDITRGARTDLDKARAIYEWVVDNTFRKPTTQGCGLGDIRFMLETKDLGGKCADLNALFVGLARAAGLPARDVYGIRVAPSELGYASLGTSSATVTKSQHCRAEVYVAPYGWIPVDPADVRKVALEEPPGNRSLDDPMVKSARARLFGSWEMNWIPFNVAHDVVLPGSKGPALPFFMYPQGETDAGRLDPLSPETFKYEITASVVAGL
jgi:transglutaminase-like putative cysteine protease